MSQDAKTDIPGLYRSPEGFLINKDNDALKAYKKSKIQAQRLISLENDVADMKSDLQEIKELLKGLVK